MRMRFSHVGGQTTAYNVIWVYSCLLGTNTRYMFISKRNGKSGNTCHLILFQITNPRFQNARKLIVPLALNIGVLNVTMRICYTDLLINNAKVPVDIAFNYLKY